MPRTANHLGQLLREWRSTLGLSQLDLALAAGVSSRHLSFIETGRTQPSRAMVLRLASTMGVPLRERNALLEAAGYAPLHSETSLGEDRLARVHSALALMLRGHEPYPAFAVDRSWDVRMANRPHERLLAMFLPHGAGEPVNVMQLVLDPGLLRPHVSNWEQAAHVLGHRLRRQLRHPGGNASVRARLEGFLALPGVREAMSAPPPESDMAVLPLVLTLQGQRLAWFSTIATLGTPLDVTLEELSIELLFPADAETEATVRGLLAAKDRPVSGRSASRSPQ